MTLDLTTTNLFSNPGGSGGAIAQPASGGNGTAQGVPSVEPGASPFALMVNANQAQTIQAQSTAVAPTPANAAAPAQVATTANASATQTATPVREAALTSASPLAMDATAPVTVPGAAAGDVELGEELVIPVTPVAPVAPVGTKPARPVQNPIDASNPSGASNAGASTSGASNTGSPMAGDALSTATPAATANTQLATAASAPTAPVQASAQSPQAATPQPRVTDGVAESLSPQGDTKAVGAAKPVSEIILTKPGPVAQPGTSSAAPATLQSQPPGLTAQAATAATGQATIVETPTTQAQAGQAQATPVQAPAQAQAQAQAQAGQAQAVTSPTDPKASAASATPAATTAATSAATTAANLVAPKPAETRPDATKLASGKANAAPAASASTPNAGNTTQSTATATTPAAPTTQSPTPTTDGTVSEPLRQRGQAEAAIQTASSLAARPNGRASGISNTQGGNPAQASTGAATTATPSAGTSTPDPSANLVTDKSAPVPAAQTGAPITPLSGVMGEGQAQAAAMADTAQADAALQAETDFNLTRADGRLAADRSGSHLPRFTPHSATQLAGQITKQVSNGNRVFDIRLDPAELGKVDVRIELRADNRVHAVLTVERPETLNELQRSARDLERALADAGLELGEDGLSFQMNDGQNPADEEGRSQGEALPIFTQTTEMAQRAEDELASRPRSAYGFLLSGRSGVDMQV